jgi:hypothetical protein
MAGVLQGSVIPFFVKTQWKISNTNALTYVGKLSFKVCIVSPFFSRLKLFSFISQSSIYNSSRKKKRDRVPRFVPVSVKLETTYSWHDCRKMVRCLNTERLNAEQPNAECRNAEFGTNN